MIAGLYLRERFLLLGFIYIWHAAELQERQSIRVTGQMRGSESGFKSKNKQGNRDSEFTYCLRSFSPYERKSLSRNTNNFGKHETMDYKIAFASAHSPLFLIHVFSLFPRKSLNEFISGATRAPLLKWKFMHPAFNPLIQFHKLKFPARDQPRITMALWLTARRYVSKLAEIIIECSGTHKIPYVSG